MGDNRRLDADLDHLLERRDEYLAVAGPASVGRVDDAIHDNVKRRIGHAELDERLVCKRYFIAHTPIARRGTGLRAMAVYFRHGELFEALIHERFFHKTKSVWANDGLNLVRGRNSFVCDGRSSRSAVVQTRPERVKAALHHGERHDGLTVTVPRYSKRQRAMGAFQDTISRTDSSL